MFKENNFFLTFPKAADQDVIGRNGHTYYMANGNITNYNAFVDSKNLFDQEINNDSKIYENIRKTSGSQGGNFTARFLFDYLYLMEYELITIDLTK